MTAVVAAVHASAGHTFSKPTAGEITLLEGLGVEGDAHCGATVRHRSRVRADPTAPNLRQVHLLGAEQLEGLAADGFDVAPGDLGENVTTAGVDLHALPTGTRLLLGASAVVELTGLRNPCRQIDAFAPGLLARVAVRDGHGGLDRRAGVMAVVVAAGTVRPGDPVGVVLPTGPAVPLAVVCRAGGASLRRKTRARRPPGI